MRRRRLLSATASALLAGCGDVGADGDRNPYTVDRTVSSSIDDPDSRACPPVDRGPPDVVTVETAERYALSLARGHLLEEEFDGGPAPPLETDTVAAERAGGIRVDVTVKWPSAAAPYAAVVAAAEDETDLPRRSLDAFDPAADRRIVRAVESVLETGRPRRLHGESAAKLAGMAAAKRFLLAAGAGLVRVHAFPVPDRVSVSHYRFADDAVHWAPRVDVRRARPVAVPEDDWVELTC